MITALSVIAGMIVAWYIVTWAASYITWFVVARGSVKSFQRHTGNFAEFWRLKKQGGLTRLGQPDGISRSRMAEMLEVDKAGPRVRC